MKNILVPTDFSECGYIASQVAMAIAQKNGASLHFLHAMSLPKFLKISATDAKDMPNEFRIAKGQAEQNLNNLNAEATRLKISSKVYLSHDAVIDEVLTHIDTHKTDLVVMGSYGSSGFREAFLGSNTQRVLRQSKAPVLVVKQLPRVVDFKSIVFASSFKEDVHASFRKVLEFARIYGAQIHLLYVNMPYNFEESSTSAARMQAFAKMYPGVDFKMHIYNAFDEESGILNFSHSHQIDLIAITTHGKSGFVQMLSPSITEGLANHAALPVLSVNIKS